MPGVRHGVEAGVPRVGVSWMLHPAFHAALRPELAAGRVEAVEWTVDAGFGRTTAAEPVLDAFGRAGRPGRR